MWLLFVLLMSVAGVSTNFTTPNCVVQDQADVLPVCTASSRTGRIIHIDTFKAAHDKLMSCYCSTTISASVSSVHVSYVIHNNPNFCELKFSLGSSSYCADADKNISNPVGEIKFERLLLGDAWACLKLELNLENNQEPTPMMTVECFESDDARVPNTPPKAVTMHPDIHATDRPGNTDAPVKVQDNEHKSATSSPGSGGCPACNCPACNCPACNCPACNCPSNNCPTEEKNVQNVTNETYTIGYSLEVLIGCSVGLFVAGCVIGIVVTLGMSYLRK